MITLEATWLLRSWMARTGQRFLAGSLGPWIIWPVAVALAAGSIHAQSLDDIRLDLSEGGTGWERVTSLLDSARLVFVGEWHGIAETSHVVESLLARAPFDVLALEIGAHAAREIEATARRFGLAGIESRFRKAPMSVPFLWWQEDAALAVRFLEADAGRTLVGFDRELPWSARLLLDTERVPGPVGDTLATLLAEAYAGYASFARSGDASEMLLARVGETRLRRLADLVRASSPYMATRLEALAHSVRINEGLGRGDQVAANLRVELMADGLASALHRAGAGRVLVRTGLQHAVRGPGFSGMAEPARLLVGRGAVGRDRTLHVAVVPVEGHANGWAPGAPAERLAVPHDIRTAGGRLFDIAPLLPPVGDEHWSGIDVRSLRTVPLPRGVARLVDRFDLLIFVPMATPARLLAGSPPG